MYRFLGCASLVAGVFAVQAVADSGIGVFDAGADPDGWQLLVRDLGKVSKGTIDFDQDPDYGLIGFEGPLTSAGAGPVSPGIVLDNVVIDSNPPRPGEQGLVALGSSAGFGNESNAIIYNRFGASMDIFLTEPNHTAVELRLLTVLGAAEVDISFYDKQDNLIEAIVGLPVDQGMGKGSVGQNWGFWTKEPGTTIGRINIHDPSGAVAGVMQSTYYIPEPTVLSLLAIGGSAAFRRRRRGRCEAVN